MKKDLTRFNYELAVSMSTVLAVIFILPVAAHASGSGMPGRGRYKAFWTALPAGRQDRRCRCNRYHRPRAGFREGGGLMRKY